jgi:hypothetical protein
METVGKFKSIEYDSSGIFQSGVQVTDLFSSIWTS